MIRKPSLLYLATLILAGLAAASGTPAWAAAAGDHYSVTLSYDDNPIAPTIGSFVLGNEIAAHPGYFEVASFSAVIGIPGYAYDYNLITPPSPYLPHTQLAFNPGTGLFGGIAAAHVFTSYGDQLDLGSSGTWKTDDFSDPHPFCNTAGCSGFHYGNYATAAVPEPESCALMLAGLGLTGWVAARRAKKAKTA